MKYTISAIIALIVIGGGWYLLQSQVVAPVAPVTETPATTNTSTTTTATAPTYVQSYTLAEVATHPDRTSCWSAINGAVYDLTSWIDKHPGGASRILSICGKDGSSAFDQKHAGEPKPEAMLATFKVGTLK